MYLWVYKFLMDGGLALYVRGCELAVMGHIWSRHVWFGIYTVVCQCFKNYEETANVKKNLETSC